VKLSRHTDYGLRTLIHLALHPERQCSIPEIAAAHAISRNHLMKVVQNLARFGFIETHRGRGGGIRLASPPECIRVGDVVRRTEAGCELLDCTGCRLIGACTLRGVLAQALASFMSELDEYTIADLTRPEEQRALLAANH
jgi:Rrf2 family transcriptional regulator, nitric oxide-sensitive transcriptional repressor